MNKSEDLNNLYNIYINDQRNILMLSSISFLCISISTSMKDFFEPLLILISILIIFIIIIYSFFVNTDFKYLISKAEKEDNKNIKKFTINSWKKINLLYELYTLLLVFIVICLTIKHILYYF